MELSEDGLSPPEDRNMNRKTITTWCAIPSALFLLLIGFVHSMVNFFGLRRPAARGAISRRPSLTLPFNWGFSCLCPSCLVTLLFLFLPRPPAGQWPPS